MIYDDELDQALYLAGHSVPPGRYRRIDSSDIVTLDAEDYLPASLDGRIAAYIQVPHPLQGTNAGTSRKAIAKNV